MSKFLSKNLAKIVVIVNKKVKIVEKVLQIATEIRLFLKTLSLFGSVLLVGLRMAAPT